MSDISIIPSKSIITNTGSVIESFTYYNEEDSLPNVLQMIIASTIGTNNGISFKENELLAVVKNYPSDIDIQVNSKGDLVIFGTDANKYSINDNGELIYTN